MRRELAFRHSVLFKVGANSWLPLPALQALGDSLESGKPHREFCFPQDGQAALSCLGRFID